MINENAKNVNSIEELVQIILKSERKYDLPKIVSAFEFAVSAHGDQKRSSGEPYIVHPLSVAGILVEMGMDTDSICVGLLHDVVEDTKYTLEDIRHNFGSSVAALVDGLTKIERTALHTHDEQTARNVMKMLFAVSKDFRVIIIKLADRLHNMRTLGFLPPYKQIRIATETLSIFAPIAGRLGMSKLKEELEDTALYYSDYFSYSEIEDFLLLKKDKREEFIQSIIDRINEELGKQGWNFQNKPTVTGRVKSIHGIYQKVIVGNKNMDEVYDKYAVRVIVDTIVECYVVFGMMGSIFNIMPTRTKDYIAQPKTNMYRSIHMTAISKEGIPFEIQIRTWEMHAHAEYGVAAHWKYKERIQKTDYMDNYMSWIRGALEVVQTSDDVEEIVSVIKNDIAPDEVFIYTPKGKLISLPQNSTVLDFAYRIHTEVGHKAIGAKVNGKMVSLDYILESEQVCEILTSKDPNKGPSRSWQNIVKTNEAKSKIRSWFKKECREENIEHGAASLEAEFKRNRMFIPDGELEKFLADDLKRHNCKTLDDFYASIGYGGISLQKIILRLRDKYLKDYGQTEEQELVPALDTLTKSLYDNRDNCIILDSIDVEYKLAKCCYPMPGDEIVGFVTRGHGISVHKKQCTNYLEAVERNNPEELGRWYPVMWQNPNQNMKINVNLEILATDRTALLGDIATTIGSMNIMIKENFSRTLKNKNSLISVLVEVNGQDQLNNLMKKLRRIEGVISVERGERK